MSRAKFLIKLDIIQINPTCAKCWQNMNNTVFVCYFHPWLPQQVNRFYHSPSATGQNLKKPY